VIGHRVGRVRGWLSGPHPIRSMVDSSELRVLYSGRSAIGQGSAPWTLNSQLWTVNRVARVNW
jgi:hypothetical protein